MSNRLAIAAVLTLLAGTAAAQQPPAMGQRLAGVVKSVDASHLVITTATGEMDIALAAKTRVLMRKAAKADEIKAGSYLGTSNQNTPDGGKATEVHLMESTPNVHYAMNDKGLMMTNGRVKSVAKTAKGEEMEVDYGGATTRHVVVTDETSMTRMVDVGVAGLKPGLEVSVNTVAGEARPTAAFIAITAPAAK